MLASSKDLIDAFGTSDQKLVCQEILEKGEMQVSEQERVALHETVFRDIASIVAEKTVNPNNNLPYTITMIQNAMRQIQFSVNLSKSSKSQVSGASSVASTGLPVDSKEGDDVYPPDRAEVASVQVVDEPVPAPAASKSKSGKEKSVRGGRGKSGGLEGLLAEVGLTDLHDDSDEESFDEYEVVQSNKSKKKTKKAKQVVLTTNDDDSDEDSQDDSEALATQSVSESVASTAVTASSSLPASSAGPAGNSAKQKIGKKEKRAEKELQKEREEQAKLLQERILRQKKEQHKLYRDHFKSDWHRFNLKRKMKNLPMVTSEEEFLNLPLSELQLA
eukprot:gene13603-9741_t